MFIIGKMLKMVIVMDVTTHTIKNGDKILLCAELVIDLVWKLSIVKYILKPIVNYCYHLGDTILHFWIYM